MSSQPPAPVAQMAPAPVQQPSYDQYGGGANAYAAAPANPFTPAPVAPDPVQYQQPVQNYAAPPPTSDPFGAPSFAQPAPPAQVAPVAYGQPPAAYGQPAPAAYGQSAPAPVSVDPFSPQPPAAATASAAPTPNGSANVVLTMGSLSSDGLLSPASQPGQPDRAASGNMVDMALQNLMGSIDSFGISGSAAKPAAAANNPFDSNNIMSNSTLGEIKKKTGGEKKSVMNAPPGAGALVMANSQGGNWGGFGGQQPNASQYGNMGGSMQQQQAPPQYSMSGGYGQPQQQQMGGYGQQPPMQQQMGMQQPMMQGQPPMQQQQQGYGAPQYGQQPPMQQNQWGAPSY